MLAHVSWSLKFGASLELGVWSFQRERHPQFTVHGNRVPARRHVRLCIGWEPPRRVLPQRSFFCAGSPPHLGTPRD